MIVFTVSTKHYSIFCDLPNNLIVTYNYLKYKINGKWNEGIRVTGLFFPETGIWVTNPFRSSPILMLLFVSSFLHHFLLLRLVKTTKTTLYDKPFGITNIMAYITLCLVLSEHKYHALCELLENYHVSSSIIVSLMVFQKPQILCHGMDTFRWHGLKPSKHIHSMSFPNHLKTYDMCYYDLWDLRFQKVPSIARIPKLKQ